MSKLAQMIPHSFTLGAIVCSCYTSFILKSYQALSTAMKWYAARFIFCFAVLLCARTGFSRAFSNPKDFRFEHITVNNGLSHSDGRSVIQDKAGFIWIGTNRGLNRYDGYNLKQYDLPVNPRNGISSNRIKVMHVDLNGRLWIGAERSGLSLYAAAHDAFFGFEKQLVPAKYRSLALALALADVTAITSDRQGRLWVGTTWNGVFVLTFNAQGGISKMEQLPLSVEGKPSPSRVSGLAVDANGTIWVGTLDAGLQTVRTIGSALVVQPSTLVTTAIYTLHLDWRGDLWLGTGQRVFWVNAASQRIKKKEATVQVLSQEFPSVNSIFVDSFGQLWVGTNYGLYIWQAGAVTDLTPPLDHAAPTLLLPQDGEPASVNSERIHQIFEDRNQIVWLCTSAGGVNKVDLRQKPFGLIRRPLTGPLTLANNYVNAIYKEEAQNTLWFGTRNGVASYDLTRHIYHNYLTKQYNRGLDVSAICQTTNGTLWFGTRGNGLVTLTRKAKGEQLTTYTKLPDGTDLRNASIEWITQDPRGTVWVATSFAGLHCFSSSGKHLGAYRPENSTLPTSQFTYLLYDTQRNVLWASTSNAGLLKLRVQANSVELLAQYQYARGHANSLRVNYVRSLLLDPQGTLWIGTIGGGLHQLTTDEHGRDNIRSYDQQLPKSDVESILADDAGNLWIGGTGLYRFTPRTGHCQRYDVADGLQSNAFKIGAACRAQDGTLYFGGINGINYFQPRSIQPNPFPPVIQITGLRVSNRPVAVGEQVNGRVLVRKPLSQAQIVTIKHAENDFSVEFVALNYNSPQKTRYAYRLLGYHPSWVYPVSGQRTASFTNLPAGNYTLQVKASNGEGAWSTKYATMQFQVLAPWWKTWWAYLLYCLAALGAVAWYRRFEMAQQELKNNLALKQFQAEKDKELTDLKLGFFTNISHELRTPLTLILGPMEEIAATNGAVPGLRDKIQLMHKQTRKLFNLLNQLLDFRKIESGNIPLRACCGDAVSFIKAIHQLFELKAAEKGIDYRLHLPSESVQLYFDQSKLEIVLTNLLSNAFKYTTAGNSIYLKATIVGSTSESAVFEEENLTDNYIEISVADTGTGIKAEELTYIFDPYYQASHTDALRMNGTGLGLSLVKQFIKRHSGNVTVESQVNVGTTFLLRLPFGKAHLQPSDVCQEDLPLVEAQAFENITPEIDLEGAGLPFSLPMLPRLLVVEDNEEVRFYLQQLFETEYQVLLAADGQEGWTRAIAELPNLIISDVMMPHSDGLELCQKLKQHPKTAHIPLLLLTARTATLHELEGLSLGADDYVSKPFNPALLQAKVGTLLRNRLKLHEYYQRQILLEPTEIIIADADRQFLEKAMSAVELHLNDPEFGVQMLAREMGMSQTIFYQRIKSVTGQTGVEFIRDVRVRRAAQLLAHTNLRVSEIANQVGIGDAKYFRQVFQKVFSLSPSEYAKQHRQSQGVISPTL